MEDTKRCPRCGAAKPVTEFHRDRRKKDGRRSDCKACHREERRRIERRDPDYLNRWRRENAEKRAEQEQRARRRHPDKDRARNLLRNAVYEGRIAKPDHCEGCGKKVEPKRLGGHHHDYSKPLDVEWLCSTCHTKRHREEEN